MEKLEVRVGCLTGNGASPSTRFKIKIDIGSALTQREQAILFNSARHCEVGKIHVRAASRWWRFCQWKRSTSQINQRMTGGWTH